MLKSVRRPVLAAAPWLGRFCLRWPGLVVFAVVIALSALLSTLVGPQPHAQSQDEPTNTDEWVDQGGNVEANVATLTINEGETRSYSVRLTKQPHMNADDDDWWVMIVVDGHRRSVEYYPDKVNPIVSWLPSIGRTFDRNDWSPWKDIRITAHEDEDDEDHTIVFSSELWDHDAYCPPGLHGGGTPLAMVTVHIIDDDGDLPSLSIEDAEVDEGGQAEFFVRLSEASDETVTVSYATSDRTAEAGTDKDYTAKSGTLTFLARERTKTIQIATRDDYADEPAEETFAVTLSNPSRATLADATATGTITDNDEPPEFSIMDADAAEGGLVTFNVSLNPASGKPVTVSYATADGTAKDGSDYTADSGTLTFEAGDDLKTIEVQTREDAIDEPDETFTVRLSSPSDARLPDHTATGTITDDDDPPTLSIEDTTVGEGNSAQFTVTLSPASGKIVTVDYKTADGSAEKPADYTFTSDSLTFSPGELIKTISVETREDDTDEPDEMFTVTLSNPSGATLDDDTATGTITDDDVPTLSIANATVEEGETAEFTVTLSMDSAQSITVNYWTSDGTAEAGMDYDSTSGSHSFSPGELVHTISVPTIEDENDEPNETFTVTLSSSNDVTLQPGTATGTITDNGGDGGGGGGGNGNNGNTGGNNHNTNIDDGTDLNNGGEDEDELRDVGDPGLPKISIADTTVEEGDTARFVVTLSPASDQTLTVRYRTEDGTADEGTDYRAVSRTLTFVPGDTEQTISYGRTRTTSTTRTKRLRRS